MSNVSAVSKPKNILVISSQVIRGAVGNRVNVFVLERLGFSVWAMPTVIMPWQPRQGESHKLVISAADFAAWAQDIANSPKALELDAVISGYFVLPEQVRIAAELIRKLKAKKRGLLFLCDPIMGNENGPYVSDAVMKAVMNDLVPAADLVKPNRDELEWICGAKFSGNADMAAAIKARFKVPFYVSSAFPQDKNAMGNLYYNPQGEAEAWLAEHPKIDTVLNGFGDMIASLFLFYFMQGAKGRDIAAKVTASVYEYLSWTLKIGADELALPSAPYDFMKPKAQVKLTHLALK